MHGNTLPTPAGQVTSPVLIEHVAEIRRLCKRVTSDIIEIGRRLTDCQGIVGHGHWHDWLKAEFGWSDSSALNFMRVYDMSKSANFTDLGIPFSALYLLAAPYTPEKVRAEILDRAKAGESVSVADVKEAIADAKAPKLDEPDGKARPAKVKNKPAVDSAEPVAAEAKTKIKTAVSPDDIALREFDDHSLRLLQMIRNAKPERFAKTGVHADELARLGDFLAKVASAMRVAVKRPPPAPAPKTMQSPEMHRDPLKEDWRHLDADDLEAARRAAQQYGVDHKDETHEHRQSRLSLLKRQEKRLAELRKTARAVEMATGH